ncbi:LacI family DNA-binding transcriptional regulator [Dethiobacter alkaliphilus]|uniref:LacI family DNA-binding transcriptional regulator n=1 Tax=Dethiobacter alkaliphilus TaxID=427926 RepID=UPI0022267180|nr:LacI family DNA-binding transcriptional regulator [Dethiobacter alkaliphilus]MCW3489993.1 LacI family transcriptional regulator [Dethiobacter alkaliphilus]
MVTIKDIAKKAQVSYATVSRALNNRPEVNEATREMVQQVARELGYRPNSVARSLVTKQTKSIGLVVPDITNPFFAELAQSVEEVASAAGYNVFLCNTNWDEDKELSYLNLLESRQTDGIILAQTDDHGNNIKKFLERNLPLVLTHSLFDKVDCNQVVVDDIRGGFLAANHLLWLGHHRIAYVGGNETTKATVDRLEGYKRALAEQDIAFDENLISYGSFKWQSGRERTKQLLRQNSHNPPTAVFAGNDIIALGVMQAAEEMGLKVPEQLAVVGFDDVEFASYPKIQLTTVSQPRNNMGEMAVKMLISQIKGNGVARENKKMTVQPSLVIRRSCGAVQI